MENNSMKLTFKSLSKNEGFARVCAAAFASQLDPTIEEVADIKTAVSEAVTNSIVHAYKDRVGDVCLSCAVSGDEFFIEIEDFGAGIEDVEQAMQPFYTSSGSDERSGMGFTVMQTFMDSVKVSSTPGKGTVVKMKKRIESRGK